MNISLPGPVGKKCRKCNNDRWMYMKWKNGNDGKRCAICAAAASKRWKIKNPIKYKDWSWRQRGINMTHENYITMYRSQKGECAICNIKKPKLQVDHCHKTGKIRGLLCHRCNALAQDANILRQVLSYVEGGN